MSDSSNKAPLGIVKRDPRPDEIDKILDHTLQEFGASEIGLIYGALDQERLNVYTPPGTEWQWEEYQLEYFEHNGFWAGNKARQTGISTAFSGKAFGRGILSSGNYTGIFVSYKKEEAINKIRYVKQFLEALPLAFRKKIVRDPLQLIEWENQNGTISTILSHAQKPVRGHHGDVFLDELGFYQQDYEIFESCLPVVSQVNGTIEITSTPFGKSGMFYDVISQPHEFPEFKRTWIYWWWSLRYLKEPTYDYLYKAMIEAVSMTTEERVYTFGNERLQRQFKTLPLEIFKQEFEGYFVDEQASFFPRSLIMSCMYDNAEDINDYDPRDSDFVDMTIDRALEGTVYEIQKEHPGVYFRKYDTLEELLAAVAHGEVSTNLYGGIDVGRTRHSTDFRIIEEIIDGNEVLQIERFSLNKQDWRLDDQEDYFMQILNHGILQKVVIDGAGLGVQMSETLKRYYPSNVEIIRFGGRGEKRTGLINNLRNRLESKTLALAFDRQTVDDLYAVKAVVSTTRRQTFVTEEKRRHHGDGAWALAFASYAGTPWGAKPTAMSGKVKGLNNINVNIRNPHARKFMTLEESEREKRNEVVRQAIKKERRGSLDSGAYDSIGLNNRIDPGGYIKDWDT